MNEILFRWAFDFVHIKVDMCSFSLLRGYMMMCDVAQLGIVMKT